METKSKTKTTKVVARSAEEIMNQLNSNPSTVKKYKEKLGYKYDAHDPNGVGSRITIDDANAIIKKKLLD